MPHSRTVRFSEFNESYSYPNTPSPTFSSSTLSSSELDTPPQADYRRLPLSPSSYTHFQLDDDGPDGIVEIHKVFQFTNGAKFDFDVSCNPDTISGLSSAIKAAVRSEAATTPPLPYIKVICRHLPWNLEIVPWPPRSGAIVTVWDVLCGLHRTLRTPVKEEEYDRETIPRRAEIANAYRDRCSKILDPRSKYKEEQKGVKRVDFLVGQQRFMGLHPTDQGPHVWRLSVSK